jgi:hypothetical protein
MKNKELAEQFYEISKLLNLLGDANRFRIAA